MKPQQATLSAVACILFLLFLFVHPSEAECNDTSISWCVNLTSGTPNPRNETAGPIHTCLARAEDTRAFVCRCTLKVFNCLTQVAGCSYNRFTVSGKSVASARSSNFSAESVCKRYVRKQGLDCSEKLCRFYANGASRNHIAVSVIFVVLSVVLLFMML
eukprot:PhM_4_TR852/c0_g1_i1/m.56044